MRLYGRQPATTHEISVGKLNAWLESGSKSPNEQAVKNRLRAVAGFAERSK